MKVAILKFPGGHGDRDLEYIFSKVFGEEVIFVHREEAVSAEIDLLLIPGGFPCDLTGGEENCLMNSGLKDMLIGFAGQGKKIIGFGNGFRLLCEAGLLPGSLYKNSSGSFICRYLFVKPDNMHLPLTRRLSGEKGYRIPIATYTGRFQATDEELIMLRQEDQILLRYCDHAGRITESVNYTGSVDNIAAICNRERSVIGMLPLPERAVLGMESENDGESILRSLID